MSEREAEIARTRRDIGVLTRRLDRILRISPTPAYLLAYGGPVMAQIVQLCDRLGERGAPIFEAPDEA